MRTLIVALFLSPFFSQAQQVQNVKAVQTNEDVIVTYDLADTKPVYVSLYYSKDGGNTFSPELKQVVGDVKANVKPGPNKKISWSAGKELVVFDGDLVFKVEANSKKIAYPKPFTDNYFSVEATNAYFEGANLKIEFKITNVSDSSIVRAQLKKEGTLILDDQGGIITDFDLTISGKSYDQTIEYAAGAGYKGVVTIKKVNPDISLISLLKLNFYIGRYQNGLTDFKMNLEQNQLQKVTFNGDVKITYDVRSYSLKNIPIAK